MSVRRVVTGHTPGGKSIVVSDDEVSAFPIGDRGSTATLIWGRDDTATFPDDGTPPRMAAGFPEPGGCALAIMEIGPDGTEFHEFVADALAPWVQNGTRHRWHNRGATVARMLSVTVGAYNGVEGGRPV